MKYLIKREKNFGAVVAALNTGKTLLSKAAPSLRQMAGTGIAMTAASYGVDKYIQHDAKKSGLELSQLQPQTQMLPSQQYDDNFQQKQYAISVGGVLRGLGSQSKALGKEVLSNINPLSNPLGTAGTAVTAGIPLLGYHQQKKAALDMAGNTQYQQGVPYQQQTQYSIVGLIGKGLSKAGGAIKQSAVNIRNSIKQGAKNTADYAKLWKSSPQEAWKQTKTVASDQTSKLMGMGMGGGIEGGRKVANVMASSENGMLKNLGNKMLANPNATALATGAAAMGAGSLAWDASQKLTEKAIGVADKNAFAYRNSQQQIQ